MRADGRCPYCGADVFVSSTAGLRDEGHLSDPEDPSSKIVGQTFENECAACRQWLLHVEDDNTQYALADPSDRHSETVD